MKYFSSIALGLLLMILPALAFGATQSKTILIPQKVMVGNQQLKPGNYKLKFDDSRNQTQVTFEQDGKTVTTAPAWIDHKSLKEPGMEKADVEINSASGQPELRRVYLNNEQLVFGHKDQNATSANNTPPAQ